MSYHDWAEKCPSLFNPSENSSSEENEDLSDEEAADESDEKKEKYKKNVPGEVNDNDFNSITCLYPKEPASSMIINHTSEKKNIKFRRKTKKVYEYAPGQGQIPTNWIRENNHDTIAFFTKL